MYSSCISTDLDVNDRLGVKKGVSDILFGVFCLFVCLILGSQNKIIL